MWLARLELLDGEYPRFLFLKDQWEVDGKTRPHENQGDPASAAKTAKRTSCEQSLSNQNQMVWTRDHLNLRRTAVAYAVQAPRRCK